MYLYAADGGAVHLSVCENERCIFECIFVLTSPFLNLRRGEKLPPVDFCYTAVSLSKQSPREMCFSNIMLIIFICDKGTVCKFLRKFHCCWEDWILYKHCFKLPADLFV